MAYIFDLSDAWTGGAAFTAIKMNVTDGGSTAGSLLMDLQVGGVSRFNVTKGGTLVLGTAAANIAPNDYSNTGITLAGGGGFFGYTGGIGAFSSVGNKLFYAYDGGVTDRRFTLLNGTILGFRADGGTSAPDTVLARDAANTLAQRNGVNAQAFNLYNTYTDASNYERGFMRFVSNTLRIGTEKLGTGSARALEFQTDGVTRLTIGATGITTVAAGIVVLAGDARISRSASGTILMDSNDGSTFNRLQFGNTTTAPAIKRSTATLQARLADDSAFTNIQGKLTTDTAYTAGAPTATGYIVLFDSAGTAYKVPAEAL